MHGFSFLAGVALAVAPAALAVPQSYTGYYPTGNGTTSGPIGTGYTPTSRPTTSTSTTTETHTKTTTSYVTVTLRPGTSSKGPSSKVIETSSGGTACGGTETTTVTSKDTVTVWVTPSSSTEGPTTQIPTTHLHGHSHFHSHFPASSVTPISSSSAPFGYPNSSLPHSSGTGYPTTRTPTSLPTSPISSLTSPISSRSSMTSPVSSASSLTSPVSSSSSYYPTVSSKKSHSSVVSPVTSSSSTFSPSSYSPSTTPTSSKASPTSTSTPTPTSSSGSGKRGLSYNDASLTSPFDDCNEVTWAYNWGSSSSGLTGKFEYVPMLWGDSSDYTDDWSSNVKSAIAQGAKNVLAFNEPDMPSQANMSPEDAASAFRQYLNPLSGQVSIGSPAVTNGASPMGLTWLSSFMDQCSDCSIDFAAVHWYNSAADAQDFKDHVTQAHTMTGKPVWVTEFGATGSDDEISAFLEDVMGWMDSQDFVQRYAYFMDSNGILVDGSSLSAIGSTYAGQ